MRPASRPASYVHYDMIRSIIGTGCAFRLARSDSNCQDFVCKYVRVVIRGSRVTVIWARAETALMEHYMCSSAPLLPGEEVDADRSERGGSTHTPLESSPAITMCAQDFAEMVGEMSARLGGGTCTQHAWVPRS